MIELRKNSLDFLCCPNCHGDLTLNNEGTNVDEVTSGSLLCQECKKEYKIERGIPDFVLPEYLNEKDKKWMLEYDSMARSYDLLMTLIIPTLSIGLEPFERYKWTKKLQIKSESHVLDVSTGTGKNLPLISRQIGSNGKIAAMDISNGMLNYAQMKMKRRKWKNIELHRANASYLPYKNNTFDAVMHVGGINTFGQRKKALHEMTRVAKTNAKIIIIDEGLAPEKQKTLLGKFQLRTNRLYFCQPPTKLIPHNTKNVQVTWKSDPFWPHYIMELQKT